MKIKRRKAEPPSTRNRLQRSNQDGDRLQSNATYSYNSRRNEEASNLGRQAERTKLKAAKTGRYWVQRFGLVVLLIAVVASLINVLGLSSDPKVEAINSSSQAVLTPEETAAYQKLAGNLFAGSIWNHNKITVNTTAISNDLLAKFPELDTIDITIPIAARRPIVYVGISPAALIMLEPNGAYVLSASGRAVEKATSAKALNMPGLPIISDQSSLKIVLDHQVLTPEDIHFVQTVVGQLNAKGFGVASMTLPAQAEELDVYIAGQSYFVKFNLENSDPRQQAGTFLATIAQLKSQNITPSKYVDVRVDGRAYYQ